MIYCPDVSFVTLIENQQDDTIGGQRNDEVFMWECAVVTSKGRVLGMDKRRKPCKEPERA